METIEIILIGFIILYLGLVLVFYFWFLTLRNIYTQKILFLNERLSVKDLQSYDLAKEGLISFDRITLEGEKMYPPPIIENNLANDSYKDSVLKLTSIKSNMLRKIKLASFILLPIIFILIAIWVF